MKLQDLASKPKLVKVTISEEGIVKKYGEELEFYINDRLPIQEYTKLASIKSDDAIAMYDALRNLILNEDGKPVMDDDKVLPMDVLNAAVLKVTESLGK